MNKSENTLDSLTKASIKADLSVIAPKLNSTQIPQETVILIIDRLSECMGLPMSSAFIAVALLFLKGAASNGAPLTMEVVVLDSDNTEVTITKYDLLMAYERVTKNKYLRRMAESMADKIGQFAEAKGLNGDLALKLNNSLLAEKEPPLTVKEKAWASSFSPAIPDLEKLAGERIPCLLAKNLQNRKEKIEKKPVADKTKPPKAAALNKPKK